MKKSQCSIQKTGEDARIRVDVEPVAGRRPAVDLFIIATFSDSAEDSVPTSEGTGFALASDASRSPTTTNSTARGSRT